MIVNFKLIALARDKQGDTFCFSKQERLLELPSCTLTDEATLESTTLELIKHTNLAPFWVKLENGGYYKKGEQLDIFFFCSIPYDTKVDGYMVGQEVWALEDKHKLVQKAVQRL